MECVIAVLLLLSTTAVTALPLSKTSHGVFITPDNIQKLAIYLDDSVSITDRYVQVSTGSGEEKLIEVPLAGPGELSSQVSIRLTGAFDDPDAHKIDSDIRVGISDGTNVNLFTLSDVSHSYVCRPTATEHENNIVHENYFPSQVALHFQPFHRYGACQSAHDGGYVNIGRFQDQLDMSKGLSLVVYRDDPAESYRIYFFTVETF